MSRLALALVPGMKVVLKVPIDPYSENGFFARKGSVTITSGDKTFDVVLKNGFAVVYSDVGKLTTAKGETGAVVTYVHQRPMRNEIRFYATTGEIGFVDIVDVPIHDHSSIITGGPAYGTYFSDDETIT